MGIHRGVRSKENIMSMRMMSVLVAVAGIVTPVVAAPPVIRSAQPSTPASVGLYEKF